MANYQYSADLIDDALQRAGEKTDGTSSFDARALRFLNRAYQAVWSGGNELNPEIDETWWWLRSSAPGVLTLDPVIETGTVSVTNNSTSITFSIAPTPSVALRYFKTTNHADVFRISAHTAAATAATLDSVYTGDTDTAATYKVMAIEYTLASDVKNLIGPMRAYQDQVYRIEGIDENSLDRDYPLREIQGGVPRAFSMITNSKVRFSHYGGSESTDLIRVDYDYLIVPSALTDSGSEEPLVPIEYRRLLSDFALMFLLSDKHDSRAEDAARLAQSGLTAMAQENRRRQIRLTSQPGHIYPRPISLSKNRAPLRTASGLIIG